MKTWRKQEISMTGMALFVIDNDEKRLPTYVSVQLPEKVVDEILQMKKEKDITKTNKRQCCDNCKSFYHTKVNGVDIIRCMFHSKQLFFDSYTYGCIEFEDNNAQQQTQNPRTSPSHT